MEREEKDLVLRDLCGRLPYGVKVSVNGGKEPWTLKGMFEGEHTGMMLILEPLFPSKDVSPQTSNWQLSQCKPYLRPMSSMTEEERNELKEYLDAEEVDCNGFGYSEGGTLEDYISSIPYSICVGVVNWLNKNMFDYRGLIPKRLALEAKEGMYNNQNEKDMTKKNKPTYDGEWDFSYPLIKITDMNRPVVLNDERFWGK